MSQESLPEFLVRSEECDSTETLLARLCRATETFKAAKAETERLQEINKDTLQLLDAAITRARGEHPL